MRVVIFPATFLLLATLVFTACAQEEEAPPSATPTPSSSSVAEEFLGLWQEGSYSEMYDLLASSAQAEISRQDFVARYQAIAEEATINSVSYLFQPSPDPDASELPFSVTISTAFFDDVVQMNTMELVKEGEGSEERWRILWSPSLIFRELTGTSLVHFFTDVPQRGAIYDRHGNPLALDGRVHVVGAVPGLIKDKEALISTLAEKLEMTEEKIREEVEADVPSYYFIPLKILPYGTPEEVIQPFYQLEGVVVRPQLQRAYPQGSLAGHTLGYLMEVSQEQLEELAGQGYRAGDMVGAAGLEAYFQDELAGQRGGTLAIITPEGTISHVLAKKEARPGRDIHLTIDIDVQREAEAALGDREGSIIVMDPIDNSILAIASHPTLNPNDFIDGLSTEVFQQLASDPRQPFFHRAVLATTAPGSTFKVVTMAAGLEKGGYTASSTLPCPPMWYGLGPEYPKRNWQSVDRGLLTLGQGLMASCNPVFYEVGLTLDHTDPEILPSFAAAFGFGKPSGVVGLDEAKGVAAGPDWKLEQWEEPWYSGDSVNMSIGQGFLLVTPLQLANMYSAIAGSGILRAPLLVQLIASADGVVSQEFTAAEINPLPASQATLEAIRDGLTLVVADPGGTAYSTFLGSSVAAAGKSGTAEDIIFQDHVFFVAYAPRDDPAIVALVALDEGQSGSLEAGPMVRRVLEAYLAGG
ncbi:MAG: penicillin-binding protein 2 [Dehalococcoidia bacterium]|nr:MAG: penicillin-binding protein 2 [Dehalococcoidia bacterium]